MMRIIQCGWLFFFMSHWCYASPLYQNKDEPGDPPRSLKAGGKILFKNNSQKIGGKCSARRYWIELEGLRNPKAQEKINQYIQKKLTIGKKLKEKDCVSGDLLTEYLNSAEVIGQRTKALGVKFYIKLSSHIVSCAVFNLDTGDSYQLEKYLSKWGKDFIAEKMCAQMGESHLRKKDFCSGFEQAKEALYYEFAFCLKDQGVEVSYGTDHSRQDNPILIPEPSLRKAFNFPPELQIN